jgi:hypothetical protein
MVDIGFGLDLLCASKKDYVETSLESKLSFEINSLSDNLQGIVEDINNIADLSVYDGRNIIKIKHTITDYIKSLINVYLGNGEKDFYLWLDSIGILNIEFGESIDSSVFTVATDINDRCSKSELEKYIHFGNTYINHGTYEKLGDVTNKELILFVPIIDVIPIGVPTFYIPKGIL